MKKKIFAAASASLAVAAVPVMGVFAATTNTDTIVVTVSPSCEMTVTTGADGTNSTYEKTITNGNTESTIGNTQMAVSCNNAAGWALKAVGAGEVSGDVTKMKPTGSGTAISTGTTITASADSSWAFKVSGTGTVSSFNEFSQVPATATKVAGTSGSVSGNTITATYQVHIGPAQEADTYTGKVTYTLVNPANA